MVFLVSDPLQLGVTVQESGVDHATSGDYNLAALDYLPKCGLHWVGNCNELNAGT
jgi:TPP-dependent 2-oxoacid decarboxylase